jgi:hypothetical protein
MNIVFCDACSRPAHVKENTHSLSPVGKYPKHAAGVEVGVFFRYVWHDGEALVQKPDYCADCKVFFLERLIAKIKLTGSSDNNPPATK